MVENACGQLRKWVGFVLRLARQSNDRQSESARESTDDIDTISILFDIAISMIIKYEEAKADRTVPR